MGVDFPYMASITVLSCNVDDRALLYIIVVKVVPLSTQETRLYDEMICQEVNAVVRDIFLLLHRGV
jgi:hypothetical protein